MRQAIVKTMLLLIMGLASMTSSHVLAATTGVGKAIISIGKVFTTSKDGKEKKLKRRGKVFEGDTIKVGKKSRLQLRFIDNQLVVLKANTVFRIDEYKFKDKNDNKKSAALTLLKGGMRSVTGLIGKSARDKYKVRTPVATMGVRGTHYILQVCSGDCGDGVKGLVGTVLEGEIEMTNDGGTSTFGTDQFFNVPSSNDAPKTMTNPPAVLISRSETKSEDEDNDKNKKGGKNKKQIVKNAKGLSKTGSKKNLKLSKLAASRQATEKVNRRSIRVGRQNGPRRSRLPPPKINPNLDPNVTPLGFITPTVAPTNAVLIFSGIDGISGVPNGGGAVQDFNSSTIGIATVGGVGNQPVAGNLNLPSRTTNFAILSNAAAIGQGGDQLGVNWGRWVNSDVVIKNNGNDVKLLTGLAFIYSQNLTSTTAIGNLSSTTTYTTSAGPSVRDETGALVTGSLGLTIDFAGAAITGFNGTLTGNGRSYNVSLDTPGAFPLLTFVTGDTVPITAGCSGCPDQISFLIGETGGAFIGPNAEAFIGSFGLGGIGATGQKIGISGSRFFTPGTPPL